MVVLLSKFLLWVLNVLPLFRVFRGSPPPFQHFLGPWNALERFQKSVAGARRLRRFSVALQIHVEAG
jgi:hypothetical protein